MTSEKLWILVLRTPKLRNCKQDYPTMQLKHLTFRSTLSRVVWHFLLRLNLPTGINLNGVVKLKTQLQQAEAKVHQLESKLKDAEEDAHIKATEMIIQLREYESGEYGLAEAMSEIKELRQQRHIQDRQIEQLVQASNKLQAEVSQLEEQNMTLREQLGLPAEVPVCVDGITAQRKKERLLMKVLQQQAERFEEEKLQLKLENRELNQRLSRISLQMQSLWLQPDTGMASEAILMSSVEKFSQGTEMVTLVPSTADRA